QAPGTDLLAFQFLPAQPQLLRTRMGLLNQRELDSVAKQCGRRFTMTETCGGGGYSYGLRDMKALEDFCLALGVNLINPHICDSTLAGHAKYDWAQTISDHSPWFEDYRRQCDHNARVVTALRQGKNRHRLLVLQPTSSAWCDYRIGDANTALDALCENQLRLLEDLEAQQIDYDLGDENMIGDMADIDDEHFVVGACAYQAVLLPPGCRNLRTGTLALLRQWAAAGKPLYAVDPEPALVDGRPGECGLATLPGWQQLADRSALLTTLRQQLPPRISAPDGGPLPAGLLWRLVDCDDEQVLFCCNPWTETWRGAIRLPSPGALELHTDTGGSSVALLRNGVLDLELPPSGHCLLYCGERFVTADTANSRPSATTIPCQFDGGERMHDNIVVLDYCDLQVGSRHWPVDCVSKQEQRIWPALGIAHSNKPFRDRHQRRAIPAEPLRLQFPCSIDPGVDLDDLQLLVERPWLWRISVNDHELDWQQGQPFFDHDWRRLAVAQLLRHGDNQIVLSCDRPGWWNCPMPIHVTGDFALASQQHGWRLTRPEGLDLGDATSQGLPCYPWGLRYRYRFDLERASDVEIALPAWQGSVARCLIDGKPVGSIVHAHDRLQWPQLTAGTHLLEVELQGHLGNLMGPHHYDGLPGIWSWVAAPDTQPAGADYRRRPHGLMQAPQLEAHG
ncbi:MAG: hypothetical protein ACOCXA_07625, partial [Planctomycetota bacterium]